MFINLSTHLSKQAYAVLAALLLVSMPITSLFAASQAQSEPTPVDYFEHVQAGDTAEMGMQFYNVIAAHICKAEGVPEISDLFTPIEVAGESSEGDQPDLEMSEEEKKKKEASENMQGVMRYVGEVFKLFQNDWKKSDEVDPVFFEGHKSQYGTYLKVAQVFLKFTFGNGKESDDKIDISSLAGMIGTLANFEKMLLGYVESGMKNDLFMEIVNTILQAQQLYSSDSKAKKIKESCCGYESFEVLRDENFAREQDRILSIVVGMQEFSKMLPPYLALAQKTIATLQGFSDISSIVNFLCENNSLVRQLLEQFDIDSGRATLDSIVQIIKESLQKRFLAPEAPLSQVDREKIERFIDDFVQNLNDSEKRNEILDSLEKIVDPLITISATFEDALNRVRKDIEHQQLMTFQDSVKDFHRKIFNSDGEPGTLVKKWLDAVNDGPDTVLDYLRAFEESEKLQMLLAAAHSFPFGKQGAHFARMILHRRLLSKYQHAYRDMLSSGYSHDQMRTLYDVLIGHQSSGLLARANLAANTGIRDIPTEEYARKLDDVIKMAPEKLIIALEEDLNYLISNIGNFNPIGNSVIPPKAVNVISQVIFKEPLEKLRLIKELIELRRKRDRTNDDIKEGVEKFRRLMAIVNQQNLATNKEIRKQREQIVKLQNQLRYNMQTQRKVGRTLENRNKELAELLAPWHPASTVSFKQIRDGLLAVIKPFVEESSKSTVEKVRELKGKIFRTAAKLDKKSSKNAAEILGRIEQNSYVKLDDNKIGKLNENDLKVAHTQLGKIFADVKGLYFAGPLPPGFDVKQVLQEDDERDEGDDVELKIEKPKKIDWLKEFDVNSGEGWLVQEQAKLWNQLAENGIGSPGEMMSLDTDTGYENAISHDAIVDGLCCILQVNDADVRNIIESVESELREQKEIELAREHKSQVQEEKMVLDELKRENKRVLKHFEKRKEAHGEYLKEITPLLSIPLPFVTDHMEHNKHPEGLNLRQLPGPFKNLPVPTQIGVKREDFRKLPVIALQLYFDRLFYDAFKEKRFKRIKKDLLDNHEQFIEMTCFTDSDKVAAKMLNTHFTKKHRLYTLNPKNWPEKMTILRYFAADSAMNALRRSSLISSWPQIRKHVRDGLLDSDYDLANWSKSMDLTVQDVSLGVQSLSTLSLTTVLEPLLRPQSGGMNTFLKFYRTALFFMMFSGSLNIGKKTSDVVNHALFGLAAHVASFMLTLRFLEGEYHKAWTTHVVRDRRVLHYLLKEYKQVLHDLSGATNEREVYLKRKKKIECRIDDFIEQGFEHSTSANEIGQMTGSAYFDHIGKLYKSSALANLCVGGVLSIPLVYGGYNFIRNWIR